MGGADRRRRRRSGRVLDALVWGTALGAAAGAALGAAIDEIGAGVGALLGAALYAPAEAFTSYRRGVAEVKPLWQRIVSSALPMALFGWRGLGPALRGARRRCRAGAGRGGGRDRLSRDRGYRAPSTASATP